MRMSIMPTKSMKPIKLSMASRLSAVIAAAVLFLSVCAPQQPYVPPPDDLAAVDSSSSPAKYVFLFIGDGMGLSHVAAAEVFLSASSDRIGNAELSFTRFASQGFVSTYSANSYITCSAAAGTALSAGYKTNNGMVCVGPQGQKYKSIAYTLKEAGYKIGVATSVSINHATPAVFYAVTESRDNYYAIASQLAPSGFDFFAGSGFLHPSGRDGNEESVFTQIDKYGYAVVRTPADLKKTPASQKLILFQEESRSQDALTPAVKRTGNDGWTLVDFTRAGIDRLESSNGFFFMVEGGRIDWAAHENDAAGVVYEVLDFADAVEIAVEFYRKRPDETLIVVTADHATGGLALGVGSLPYELKPELLNTRNGGVSRTMTDAETAALNAEAGFGWTTGAHTGEPVPVYALGVGSERFVGRMDNTDIPKRILGAMGVRGQF